MVVETVWMAVDSVDCRRQCGLQETTWMVVDSVYRGRDSVDGGRDSVDGRRQRGLQETTWMAAETEWMAVEIVWMAVDCVDCRRLDCTEMGLFRRFKGSRDHF